MALDQIQVSEHYYWREGLFWDDRSAQAVSDSSYDVKVSVFEDREFAWFLDVAQRMVAEGPSTDDYAALSIALAYIEGIEQYRQGTQTPDRKSGVWFKASAKSIFTKATSKDIDRLWSEVRNGLFHSGFTIGRTYLDYSLNRPLKSTEQGLLINPKTFVHATVDDFRGYVQELRANPTGQLGKQFLKLWDERWEKW